MKRIILALAVLALLVGCQSVDRTVSTTGMSTISAQPDEASVVFSVETIGATADQANSKNAEIVSKIQQELDTTTEYINVYEEFDYAESGRKSKGYKASHTLKVQVENFDEIGSIIDKALELGATRLSGVNFELSEEKQKEIKKEALEKASEDAREKAEAIASGMQLKLGKVTSVSDVNYNYYPYAMLKSDMAMAEGVSESIEINPSEVEVYAQVKVVYSLK